MTSILDTSVIVRYLTDDPANLAALAASIIDSEEEFAVPEVVVAETAHVLRSFYGTPRENVVNNMIRLFAKANVRPLILSKTLMLQALLLCRPSNRVSVPDALTWAAAIAGAPLPIYTFDARFPSQGVELRSA